MSLETASILIKAVLGDDDVADDDSTEGTDDHLDDNQVIDDDNKQDKTKFGRAGGCDCGYNPRTCGAGHTCRWQYG
jgi:hypothetical protein